MAYAPWFARGEESGKKVENGGRIIPIAPPANFFDPYYRMLHLPLVFIFGACMGSFYNVCIYRIPLGMSLSFPGSHCYRCGRPVRWYDNIPLISYWILRGRCRNCGASFSARYFGVELLTATLFLLCFLRFEYSLTFFQGLVFISLLIIATFTDIDHWIIPDRVSLGGLVLGLVMAGLLSLGLQLGLSGPLATRLELDNPLMEWLLPLPFAWTPLANSLLGAGVGFGVMWGIGALGSLIFRKEAMGWGDIKLFAMFGAFCGVQYLLYILILACFFGTAAGLVSIILGRRAARQPADPALAQLRADPEKIEAMTRPLPLSAAERSVAARALASPGVVGAVRHHLPFGPSLALAALIVLLHGQDIARIFNRLVMGESLSGTEWMR